MTMQIRQDLKLEQQLALTPQLQQAIQMLLLTRAEMEQKVEEALVENPLLEECAAEVDGGKIGGADLGAKKNDEYDDSRNIDDTANTDIDELFRQFESGRQLPTATYQAEDADDDDRATQMRQTETLLSYLDGQLYTSPLDENQRRIAQHIFGNLDRRGYLSSSFTELADECNDDDDYGFDAYDLQPSIELEHYVAGEGAHGAVRGHECYPDVVPGDVEEVLMFVQKYFEPAGIGARNLEECLTIQLHRLNEESPLPHYELLLEIVGEHLPLLETKNYKKIARLTGAALDDVCEATRRLVMLEPTPARRFGSDAGRYITPDIYIDEVDGRFVPRINDEGIPKLRISSYYQALAATDGCDAETKAYILEKARAAKFFIESIYERQNTIFRVTQSIIKFQNDFFERGVEYLKPLILRDVAEDIGVHESTVSRVTTNKYVDTPRGVFELKYFFNSSIGATAGESFGSEAIKAKIREIIAGEDGRKPLSDSKIVTLLTDDGVDISRRTVAKYREAMGILPSAKRKQLI